MGREIPSWLSAARQPAHTAASLTPRSLPTEKPPGTRPEEEGLSPGFLSEFGGQRAGEETRGGWGLDAELCLPAAPGFYSLMARGSPVEISRVFGRPCRIHLILPGPAGQRHPAPDPQGSVFFYFFLERKSKLNLPRSPILSFLSKTYHLEVTFHI